MATSVALYVGLNPALQRRVDLERLAVGSVNRAKSSSSGVGGKGQGAFVAATQLHEADVAEGLEGLPSPRLCMFLGAGREGDELGELLAQRAAKIGGPAEALWTRVASRCRICTTLVEAATGDATEVVEPSGSVMWAEWEALLESLAGSHDGGGVAALGILGTMPPGVPADGYSQVLQRACGPRTKVLIDSIVDVRQTLIAAAGRVRSGDGGGVILKLNAREILKLAGQELQGSDSQVAADPALVAKACRELAAGTGGGPDYVCFTDGPFPGGVVAVGSGRTWRLTRQRKLRGPVVSPIGAGDSTSAGTLHAWCRGSAAADADARVVEAFRFGLAVGAASCLTGENAVFDMADVRDIHDSIEVVET